VPDDGMASDFEEGFGDVEGERAEASATRRTSDLSNKMLVLPKMLWSKEGEAHQDDGLGRAARLLSSMRDLERHDRQLCREGKRERVALLMRQCRPEMRSLDVDEKSEVWQENGWG
jgi:hypothetical protein